VLRLGGNFALVAVLGLTALQVVRLAHPGLDLALPQVGLPEQRVEGTETHIRMAPDGHFWIKAKVNGHSRRFLVDTGATLTAVSAEMAEESGIEPNPGRMPVNLRTANGSMAAQLATIGELAFGSIVARDLDAVIAPGLGGMNVLGMNFLSQLKGWRVEDGVLILVPHHPQAERFPPEAAFAGGWAAIKQFLQRFVQAQRGNRSVLRCIDPVIADPGAQA
jgi:aspartyl protease family protein